MCRIAGFPNAAHGRIIVPGLPHHVGNAEFIAGLERILGRRFAKRAPGRKPRSRDDKQIVLF